MKKKYLVKVTVDYYDDGCIYKTETTHHETIATSPKKAENNIRFRLIGNKYNTVDHQPYNERYSEVYNFEAQEV